MEASKAELKLSVSRKRRPQHVHHPMMTESLMDDYPEAAPYIQQAIEEHGEEWVLEHYYEQLYLFGQVISMPDKDKLPFYNQDKPDPMTEDESGDVSSVGGRSRESPHGGQNLTSDCNPTFFSPVVVE